PTYQTLTYDFPRTLLPASGPLEATEKGDDFTTTLRMTLIGTTVEAGYFRYSGLAQCSGSSEWTAARVPG
ncbi:MAG: hypothetical protein J0H06_16605, partial [Actinobacteria bacterium]|nr:hypothetical protein [Actinomycetota bacterium]